MGVCGELETEINGDGLGTLLPMEMGSPGITLSCDLWAHLPWQQKMPGLSALQHTACPHVTKNMRGFYSLMGRLLRPHTGSTITPRNQGFQFPNK